MNTDKKITKSRADMIKETYLSTGVIIDSGQFDCGDHIKSILQHDMRTIKTVIKYLQEFLGDKIDKNDRQAKTVTGNERLLISAISILKESIEI